MTQCCGDILAVGASKLAGNPHHAAAMVWKGQLGSQPPTLLWKFSTTVVMDQQCTHGQRVELADLLCSWSSLRTHLPRGSGE